MIFGSLIVKSAFGLGFLSYVSIIFYLISVLLFIAHLIKDNSLSFTNRILLFIVIAPNLIYVILKGFHLPGIAFVYIGSLVSISITGYLNFKKLEGLREELRLADLFSILMLINLIGFIYKVMKV